MKGTTKSFNIPTVESDVIRELFSTGGKRSINPQEKWRGKDARNTDGRRQDMSNGSAIGI